MELTTRLYSSRPLLSYLFLSSLSPQVCVRSSPQTCYIHPRTLQQINTDHTRAPRSLTSYAYLVVAWSCFQTSVAPRAPLEDRNICGVRLCECVWCVCQLINVSVSSMSCLSSLCLCCFPRETEGGRGDERRRERMREGMERRERERRRTRRHREREMRKRGGRGMI